MQLDITTIILGIVLILLVLFVLAIIIAESSLYGAIIRARRKFDRIR